MNEQETAALEAWDAYFDALSENGIESSIVQKMRAQFGDLYLGLSEDERTTVRERARDSRAFLAYFAQTSPLRPTSPSDSEFIDPAEMMRRIDNTIAVVYSARQTPIDNGRNA